MFTGIIEAVGAIMALEPRGEDMRVRVGTGSLDLADVNIGDSIAVSGVCLTAIQLGKEDFSADVSGETLVRTIFTDMKVGDGVNLEKALTPTTRLGGHLVSGHVDGIGTVVEKSATGRSLRFRIQPPKDLCRYIAEKGSVCVDGISLTVNAVSPEGFDVNIVPHTLEQTTFGGFEIGRRVNLEVDIIARYLERLLVGDQTAPVSGVTVELLRRHGFLEQ